MTCFTVSITADNIPESREVFGTFIFVGEERGVVLSPDEGTVVIEGLSMIF